MITSKIRNLFRRILLPVALLVSLTALAAGADEEDAKVVRIGTFDSRCVAFAYGRATGEGTLMDRVAKMKRAHAEAEKAGDEEKAAELEKQGEALQHEMHLKVFCGAPIDDILDLVRDDIPSAAEAAGVDVIVGEVLYEGPGVEIVDVSVEMASLFTTDAEVLGMVPEILAAPVADPEELEKGHH